MIAFSLSTPLLSSDVHAADLPAPQAGKPVPRVITFQRKRANRRVINEDQLMRMLRKFGEVSVLIEASPCIWDDLAVLYAAMI